MALALVATACGAADADEGDPTGPTVADGRFDGRFALVEAVLDGGTGADGSDGGEDDGGPASGADRLTGVVFEFDARFGALAVETACGELLGSFTLLDDGRAGVSITGGRSAECDADDRDAVDALVAALGRVEAWDDADDGFELRSAAARDRLRLAS